MKVKALAVAPYEGLAIQLGKAAQLRDDIDVKCLTGDLEEGLLLARSEFDGSYDVVISRGGTADLLRENGFTVVDIPITLYDLLRAIRQASGARKRYAIVGFEPVTRNASFLQDGQAYYLMDTQSVEMFADHTVYLAVYQGFVPSYSMFSAAEDGTLAMREDVVGCMFTLPLDVNKADPEAVDAFFQETGLFRELFTDEELAAREEETAQEDARITAPGTYGSVEVIEVPGHGLVTTMQAQAAAEYEAFMERETARLEQEAAAGTLSEADYEAAVQEMADSLAGLWDGTRSPTWHANPADTLILQTQPSAGALAEQAGSMG